MRLPLRLPVLFAVVAMLTAACAAPIQRPLAVTAPAPFQLSQQARSPRYSAQSRPSIGVAFGGGSARGIAHVGVIRWLAEHRIPIDVAAGTSMGGLIGGSFATGMDADEIATMLGGHRLGRDVRVVELRLQEHPPQGRFAGLPDPTGVRPEGRHRRRRPRSTTASRSSCCSGASPGPTPTSTTSTASRRRSGPWPSTSSAPAKW